MRLFLRVFSGGMIATALIGSLESVGLRPIESALDRPGSTLGNASDLGVLAVCGVALLLRPAARWIAPRDRRRDAWGVLTPIGLLASLVAVAASGSRAAAVASVGVLIVLAIWGIRIRRGGGGRDLLVASLGSCGVAVLGFLDEDWYVGVGVGIGSVLESPRSFELQILAAGGAVGAVLALAFVVLGVLRLRRRGIALSFGVPGLVAVTAVVVALSTHLTSPATVIPAAMVGGALLSRGAPAAHRPHPAIRWSALTAEGELYHHSKPHG
jgi:hypothetical protein